MNGIFRPSVRHIKTLQEESAKKSNIPWIWRIIYGQKLPYMKKTSKKKQVCGAACFMAAEIKFSKDVRPSHLFDYVPIVVSSRNFQELLPMTKVTSMQNVKVRSQKSRSHGSKIVKFDPNWAFPDCNSSLNSPIATKWCTKLEVAWKRCPIVFQGHPSNCKVTQL